MVSNLCILFDLEDFFVHFLSASVQYKDVSRCDVFFLKKNKLSNANILEFLRHEFLLSMTVDLIVGLKPDAVSALNRFSKKYVNTKL